MVIPSDTYECNATNTKSGDSSPSVQSGHISSEPSMDPASVVTSINQLATNDDTSDSSSQMITSSKRVLTPLNTKRPAENTLYVKRGSSKKSKIMEDAVNAIKNIAEENVSPPKMDEFDMLGAYIASRLRSMTPEDRKYYERKILTVLIILSHHKAVIRYHTLIDIIHLTLMLIIYINIYILLLPVILYNQHLSY